MTDWRGSQMKADRGRRDAGWIETGTPLGVVVGQRLTIWTSPIQEVRVLEVDGYTRFRVQRVRSFRWPRLSWWQRVRSR